MGHSRQYHIMGYAEAVHGSRRVYTAMNLLEAYQENVKAIRRGEPRPVEWTYQTETGRRILGLEVGKWFRKAEDMPRPPGLVICPRCQDKGCQICNWSGETTRRHLSGYKPWQLEPQAESSKMGRE